MNQKLIQNAIELFHRKWLPAIKEKCMESYEKQKIAYNTAREKKIKELEVKLKKTNLTEKERKYLIERCSVTSCEELLDIKYPKSGHYGDTALYKEFEKLLLDAEIQLTVTQDVANALKDLSKKIEELLK